MYNELHQTLEQKVFLGQYFLAELKKVEDHFIKSSEEFYKVYKYKTPGTGNSNSIKQEVEKNPLLHKVCRRLYKRLVKVAHPDVPNSLNIFHIIDSSYKQFDILTLYSYIRILNLKIQNKDLQDIDLLVSENLDQIKNRIQALKTTIGWRWYNSSIEERKLIEHFVESTFSLEKH